MLEGASHMCLYYDELSVIEDVHSGYRQLRRQCVSEAVEAEQSLSDQRERGSRLSSGWQNKMLTNGNALYSLPCSVGTRKGLASSSGFVQHCQNSIAWDTIVQRRELREAHWLHIVDTGRDRVL